MCEKSEQICGQGLGPWEATPQDGFPGHCFVAQVFDADGQSLASIQTSYDVDKASRIARLIAAAPDHALIVWAMCVGAGSWQPIDDLSGEFCINGIRHFTKLDEFGCPVMTAGMRDAIRKAGGRT